MSSNPPNINELLRLLLQQQQQQHWQQQQPVPLQLNQEQNRPASISQVNNQGFALPPGPGTSASLQNLLADYLMAPRATTASSGTAMSTAPMAAAPHLQFNCNDQANGHQTQHQQPAPLQSNQEQNRPASISQVNNQGFALPPGPGTSASLQNLLADYQMASQAGTAMSTAPMAAAPHFQVNQSAQSQPLAVTEEQRTLLKLSTMLSTINQNLTTAQVQHVLNLNQQQQPQGIMTCSGISQAQPNQQDRLQGTSTQQRNDQDQEQPSQTAVNSGFSTVHPNTRISHLTPSKQTTGKVSITSTKTDEKTTHLPMKPVSVATLRSYDLRQLESHVEQLQRSNEPVPRIVQVLLDDARQREQKLIAKRLSNRKSAMNSRNRKKELVEQLASDNDKLRRQALILSYLPDPVVMISVDGKIKFCNLQLARVLRHKVEDLEGASIEDLIVPESRGSLRRLIQELTVAEHFAAEGEEGTDSGSDSNGAQTISGDSSTINAGVLSRSSHSFNFSEVNVNENEKDKMCNGGNASDSSSDPTRKNNSKKSSKLKVSFGKSSKAESKGGPPAKKCKTSSISSDYKTSTSSTDMNVDDVMGDSVTANNAGAKLSSLMHKEDNDDKKSPPEENQQPRIIRKRALGPRTAAQKQDSRSSSSTESDAGPRANSSEDSGYMDSNSNGSSDETGEDSSDSFWKKAKRPRPLVPGAMVRLICSDLTTMWCELTSSIRSCGASCEDEEMGIIERNPSDQDTTLSDDEQEILLCFRPILKGENVGEELKFPPQQVSAESSNGNEESGESN